MADSAPVVHIGENSPEEVAYKLLKVIASNEGKSLIGTMSGKATADREWVLDTYAECLEAIRNSSYRLQQAKK
jgi:hypothetical protein